MINVRPQWRSLHRVLNSSVALCLISAWLSMSCALEPSVVCDGAAVVEDCPFSS